MRRFALVTGTSRGIGAAIAKRLLDRGTTVLGFARSRPAVQHPAYQHVQLDLSNLDAVERYFECGFAREIAPSVAADEVVLVNNGATMARIDRLETQRLTDLGEAFALNALVPTWLMGFVSRHFSRQAVKTINLSSGAAHRPYAGWTSYCSGKSALRMASRVHAEEQELLRSVGRPLRSVVCFAPGSVDTDIQRTIRQAGTTRFPALEKFHELERTHRLHSPQEIARAVTALVEAPNARGFHDLRYMGEGQVMCLECGTHRAVHDPRHACTSTSTRSLPVACTA